MKIYNKQKLVKAPFKPINTSNATKDILNRFSYVTRSMRDNRKGTKLYYWQQDIMYLTDEILRGSIGAAPKIVSKAYYLMQQIDMTVHSNNFNNKI